MSHAVVNENKRSHISIFICNSKFKVDTMWRLIGTVIFAWLLCTLGEHKANFYDILGVSKDAESADIKKSYRQTALELHPDKVPLNATEAQRDEAKAKFLLVQEAYEVLSDDEKRLQYDLAQKGVQYDILTTVEVDRYHTQPFSLFVRSKRFRLSFTSEFSKPIIPDLIIDVTIELSKSFTGVQDLQQVFYKRKVCNACNGNGGYDGKCRTCSLCGGTGVARHLFSIQKQTEKRGAANNKYKYEQMTETTCANCYGYGCVPDGKCAQCKGKGYIMAEDTISIHLPPGFKDSQRFTYGARGHEDIDGRVGNVVVVMHLIMPPGWSIDNRNGNLMYKMIVSFGELMSGFTHSLNCPGGETISVTVTPIKEFDASVLINGMEVADRGKGMILRMGEAQRADLIVNIEVNWTSLNDVTLQEVLQSSGLIPTDPNYLRILLLFAALVGLSNDELLRAMGYDASNASSLLGGDLTATAYPVTADDVTMIEGDGGITV